MGLHNIASMIQIALTLVPVLLGTLSAATTTLPTLTSPTISTPKASSSASGSQVTGSSSVLHPTRDEIVAYDSPYTIQWVPPDILGSISIELWDNDEWTWASSFGVSGNITNPTVPVSCDGWLVNSKCAKIATSVPNNGSYVWNVVSSLPYSTLSGEFYYYLAIYIQQPHDFLLPSENSSWYVSSGTFIIKQSSNGFTSSSLSSPGSSTSLQPTTLGLTSATIADSGPTATPPAGNTGVRPATDKFGWRVLMLIGVLVVVKLF
ncbi:hypothetical protein B0O99DRAFT_637356 [Bisporella sp. PMI_857]|nr:hypothetical protein B0O99DRAFT_637356 [Bisporella sp. PMI_857]